MVKIITSSSDFSNLGLNSSQKSLIVTKDAPSAIQIKNDFDDLRNVYLIEGMELLPYDFFSMAPNTRAKRINSLSSFLKNKESIVIASITTLLSPLPDPIHRSEERRVGKEGER